MKKLSEEMWDWNVMDGHIRPDEPRFCGLVAEWKVQEWSRKVAELEARITALEFENKCLSKQWDKD